MLIIIMIFFFGYLIINHLFNNKIIEGYEEHEKVDLKISDANNALSKHKKQYLTLKNKVNKQKKTLDNMKKKILNNRKGLKEAEDMLNGKEIDTSKMCESNPDAC